MRAVRGGIADLARHSVGEDVVGGAAGITLVSLGLAMLSSAGLVTGGLAGLSLLLSYLTPISFSIIFGMVSVPFVLLGVRRKGWAFGLRSVIAIVAISVFAQIHPHFLVLTHVDPVYAAVVGNVLCGVGVVVLFRHDASPGGLFIVALVLQERRGWRAGYVLMAFDAVVILASLTAVEPWRVVLSVGGDVLLNLIIAFNHRPGRYAAISAGSSATATPIPSLAYQLPESNQ